MHYIDTLAHIRLHRWRPSAQKNWVSDFLRTSIVPISLSNARERPQTRQMEPEPTQGPRLPWQSLGGSYIRNRVCVCVGMRPCTRTHMYTRVLMHGCVHSCLRRHSKPMTNFKHKHLRACAPHAHLHLSSRVLVWTLKRTRGRRSERETGEMLLRLLSRTEPGTEPGAQGLPTLQKRG